MAHARKLTALLAEWKNSLLERSRTQTEHPSTTGSATLFHPSYVDQKAMWISKLIGPSWHEQNPQPMFFSTLAQNDNWPEIKNHIINGNKVEMRDVDNHFKADDIHPGRNSLWR